MTTTAERATEDRREKGELTLRLENVMRQQCIPDHVRKGVINYAVHHRSVGGFLMAVFENNLYRAIALADGYNLRSFLSWMHVLNEISPEAWGSKDKVLSWLMNEDALIVECGECGQAFEFDGVKGAVGPEDGDEGLASWSCPMCHAENISTPKPVDEPDFAAIDKALDANKEST